MQGNTSATAQRVMLYAYTGGTTKHSTRSVARQIKLAGQPKTETKGKSLEREGRTGGGYREGEKENVVDEVTETSGRQRETDRKGESERQK